MSSREHPAQLRAAIYVRISLDPEQTRLGVERHREDAQRLADFRRYQVVNVYEDNDVTGSGRRRRPEFERLLADIEADLAEMDDDEMAHEMLAEMGISESGLDQLARVGFDTLGLQTYLTAGPKETRAWTIPQGATAPEAAGVIHTDFQRGFIKAEIVSFADLDAAGSMVAARAAGRVRMEGKDYVMADGDVVEFRHAT